MDRNRTIAKLTRPKLYRSLQRERLFQWLDDATACQAVWIPAPPGSGKTALLSSYIEARSIPSLWYQMDSGDADPASFFYYLATAAQTISSGEPLPLLAPEYLVDLQGFARRFFRELFSRLPPGSVIVFDNYHTIPLTSMLQEVVGTAVNEVPSDVIIIITSRLEPPAVFSRLVLSRAMLCLHQRDLQITQEEAYAIAVLEGLDPKRDLEAIQRIWEWSGGWAAGYIIMLGHRKAVGATGMEGAPSSRETLFRYFAAEIFQAADSQARHLLMRTAFLPIITGTMAESITGDREAGRRLDDLYRRRYFIDKREGPFPTYHYHALFREFLQQQAREILDPTECLLIQRRCAWLLEAERQWEHACALHIATEDWESAVRTISQQAPAMLQQGRWQTVKAWIDLLPESVLGIDPWLLYWRGACDIAVMPEEAREALEKAFEGFQKANNRIGKVMAASAIMETYYFEWSSFEPLDRWIEVLANDLSDHEGLSPEVELRARSALLAALLYRRPQHPLLNHEAARAIALLGSEIALSTRVTAGIIILNCHCFKGDLDAAGRVLALLRPQVNTSQLTPLNQLWWRIAVAYYSMLCANHEEAGTLLEEAADIAEEFRLKFIGPAVRTQQVMLALAFDEVKEAGKLLTGMAGSVEAQRRMDVALFQSAQSWHEQLIGQRASAMRHAQGALASAFETGAITIQSYCLMARAQLQLDCGEIEKAREDAVSVRIGSAGASELVDFDTLLLEAACLMHLGDQRGMRECLTSGLAIGRRHGYLNTLRWNSRMMSNVLGHALTEGIETDYVKHLIRARRITPASPDCEEWPWPLRIYSLGRFSVVIDDVPLNSSGKASARPLELLKALVAYGGREVSASSLAGQLWPDVEGDVAQHALETALHRLRKALSHDDVVITREGKLSLNPQKVWVDIWAFERLANRLEQTKKADYHDEDRLLRLYAGHFLQQDTDAPWAMAARQRLRAKMVRLAGICGLRREREQEFDRACLIYQRGIDADNLSEELYRSLMLCHFHCGRLATAIEVYRRCRQMLSVVMGIAPSRETEMAYVRMTARGEG